MASKVILDTVFSNERIICLFAQPNSLCTGAMFTAPKVRSQKKITGLFGNFSQQGWGGLPNSQNFCKLTKYFFVCQIHSEVLKHVLQRGGW